ncbi:3-hydroxy-3-methylglutaryl-coenzyme A [Tanacetum coccineum]
MLQLVSSSHSDSDNDNDESLESQIDDDSEGDHLSQDESNVALPRFDISVDDKSSSTPGILEMIRVRNVKAELRLRQWLKMRCAELSELVKEKIRIVHMSAMAGALGGFNAHANNIVSAVYLAMMEAVNNDKDFHISVSMCSIEDSELLLGRGGSGLLRRVLSKLVDLTIEARKGAAINRLKIEIRRRAVMWRLKIEKKKGKSKNLNAKTIWGRSDVKYKRRILIARREGYGLNCFAGERRRVKGSQGECKGGGYKFMVGYLMRRDYATKVKAEGKGVEGVFEIRKDVFGRRVCLIEGKGRGVGGWERVLWGTGWGVWRRGRGGEEEGVVGREGAEGGGKGGGWGGDWSGAGFNARDWE